MARLTFIDSLHLTYITSCGTHKYHMNTPFEELPIFEKSLAVDLNDKNLEIPVFSISRTLDIIRKLDSDQVKTPGFNGKIIIPIHRYDLGTSTVRTFTQFMAQSIDYYHFLKRVEISNGSIYYSGRGIILDKDFNPLLLCTIVLSTDTIGNPGKAVIKKIICHVSPRVFQNSKTVINRGIIQKLIPACLTEDFTTLRSNYTPEFTGHARVIIDNFDYFFVSPRVPIPSPNIQESLNDCLVNNIPEILNTVWL